MAADAKPWAIELFKADSPLEPPGNAVIQLAQALADHLNGDVDSALVRLGSDGVEASTVPDIVAARGHLLLRANRYAEAQTQFEQLIHLDPSLESAHFHLGVCLYELGRFQDAIRAFQESHLLAPDRSDSPVAIGNCFIHLNSAERANRTFDACLARYPDDEGALLGKVIALQLLGDLERASFAFERLIAVSSSSPESLANLVAIGLENPNQDLPRLAGCGSAVDQDPRNTGVETGTPDDGEKFDAAVDYFERLVEQNPNNLNYWRNLGVAHQRIGNHDRAVESLQKGLELCAEKSYAHNELTAILEEAKTAQSQEQARRMALENDHTEYRAAIALEETGDIRNAARAYETLLARSESMPDAWLRLGTIRMKSEEFSGAAKCFEKCILLRPEWIEAAINLAIAYERQGQRQQAGEVLRNTLNHKPDSPELVRVLAALSLQQHEYDAALEYHRHLKDLGHPGAELPHNLGLLYQNQGDFAKAAAEYKDALEIKPDFPEALLNLGYVSDATGHTDAARENWVRALELKPELALGYYLA
jgi:tetratricopeptide (TPR) repeat protein